MTIGALRFCFPVLSSEDEILKLSSWNCFSKVVVGGKPWISDLGFHLMELCANFDPA
eukprot:CAMPEP_0115117488 /NCGR_PEP_ID=MMETSP0227-20121206/43919_1 /TAXON_ID=89957 /ORGANISM="Polarella glacialis, Strain CCMP 1383" /LENGTH=56 /DNA_ID=CAMNT_0002518563 /DNA_START=31 /DNA_END=201 /DNA_ORIENTATION=+